MPSSSWIEMQTQVFQSVRELLENMNLYGLVTTPSYHHKGSVMAGGKEFGIVTDEAFLVGSRLGMFRPKWGEDKDACRSFVHSWLPPIMVPMFHVILEAFFELATNPEERK
jgi:hypothetical protein